MLISTKGRYALRALVDLAVHQGEEYVPLKEIAQRQEISEKYLEVILKALVKNRILIGLRGKGGGYRLACSPQELTVFQVLEAVEEDLHPVSCLGDATPCSRTAACATLPMWKELDQLLENFFKGHTLADLLPQMDGRTLSALASSL